MNRLRPFSIRFQYRAIIFCVSACLILTGLSACDSSASNSSVQPTSAATTTASQTTHEATSTNNETHVTSPSQPEQPEPFSEQDLVISFQDTDYALLSDASGLIAALGNSYQYHEAESCVYEGMDKTYDYGTKIIYTIPHGSVDLLDGVDILDDSIKTSRGIQVGDSRDAVLEAYGPPTGSSDYDLVYQSSGDPDRLDEPRLTFVMEEDVVSIISYYSASNAQN